MSGEGENRNPDREKREHELRNIEVINRIFLSGSDSELREVQELHKLTNEQMEMLTYYARLRQGVHASQTEDLKRREAEGPEPSEEELAAGCFRETLEIQVRDAVFVMRKKGYNTYSSGFASIGEAQHIASFGRHFTADILPEIVLDRLGEAYKLQFKIEPNYITFQTMERLTVEEITYIWDTIAAALPDLGKPAEPVVWPAAKTFREKRAIKKLP